LRVLLDECVDTRLAPYVTGFEVSTVREKGWAGISNGKLQALAQTEFDVFVTVDKNLSFQQHLPKFTIAVVLVHAKSNRAEDLRAFIPDLLKAIPAASVGVVTYIGG
jgi:hypothetical protein